MSSRSILLLSCVGLGVSACATSGAVAGQPPAVTSPVRLDWPTHGKSLEHVEAFQNQVVKVGLITLQGGAVMPEHASPLPVLLTASSGQGTVTTARDTYPLDAGHAVFLAGGERHSVTAQQGEALRIAVLGVKGTGSAKTNHQGH